MPVIPPEDRRKADTFHLPEGVVILSWPIGMSPESYQDFCEWLDLIKRKVERVSKEAFLAANPLRVAGPPTRKPLDSGDPYPK